MADIKTRDVTRGTIKTLDRAASSMHHMKEETIRSKALETGNRHDNESVGSYAQDTAEHYAGDGAAFAARAGVEMMLHSREKSSYGSEPLMDIEDSGLHDSTKMAKANGIASDNDTRVQQAFREHGIRTIRDRQSRAKLADEEVIRNAEEDRLTGRIRRASANRNRKLSRYSMGKTAGTRQKPVRTEDISLKRRREHAIKRITERNARRGALGQITTFGAKGTGKTARRTGKLLKGIAEGSKALLSTMSVGGAAAVVILVIMILFGAAFAFNEDGSYVEGYGDATIVEVARGELGNIGGDKFWKWYGFNSHVHWCACFVSWCADQCGYIEMGIIPKFAVVGDGANWFKARHRWAGRGYKPKPGDIIFFDFEQDGLLDHVGIVETCDGRTVTTIEGNSGNACKRLTYSVGSSQIAGYGLTLIPGGGSNAQKIARKATQLAYSGSPDEAKYHGGKPTAAYAAALERAYPNRSGWGKPSRDGASCDVFVGVCLVDSGVDKAFPRGYREQKVWLARKTDLYECVASITSGSISESILKDGDIVLYDKSNGGCHIFIVVGGKAKQAGHDNFYPRTNSLGNKLKISGKTLIRVYRAKG